MYLERLITLKANQGTAGKKCTFKKFFKNIFILNKLTADQRNKFFEGNQTKKN